MGSPAGISSSTDAAASTFASRSSSIRRWRSSAGRTTPRRSATCSASRIAGCCAGTTSSRSPSSRSADDERPLLAVEIPIEDADADALGLALARILGIADRLLDESKDWLWLGGRMPDHGRPDLGATSALLDRYAARLPELLEPRAEAPASADAGARRAVADPRARRVSRRLAPAPRARRGDRAARHARRHRRGPRRHAGPDDRRQRPLRRPARRSAGPGHGRPDADQPPARHDDQALLLRPRLPGRPARRVRLQADAAAGGRRAARRRLEEDLDLHAPPAQPRAQRIYSGKTHQLPARLRPRRHGRRGTRDVRVGDSLVSFPVWAFATDSTPGSTVKVTFPAGYEVEVESGEIPAPVTAADGTTTLQTGKLDKPLDVLRLSRRRSARLLRRADRDRDDRRHAGRTDDPGWADDTAWADRVGGLVSRGLPVLAEQIGLPWPRDGGLVFHETVSRTTGGYAGLFDPSPGQVEVAYDAGDFVVLHEFGPRLVQRRTARPTAGRTRRSRRTTVSRPPTNSTSRRPADDADPGARGGPHPAQRVGRRRARGRQDRGLRLRRDARPRPRDRRAGRRRRPARGLGRCGGEGRCVPAGRDRRGDAAAAGGGRTRDRRRAARLARPARPARGTDRR